MHAPRLVASDVDGTLLTPEETVSPRTAAMVERVLAAGVPFVLVTGRPTRWIPPVAEHLPGLRYAVCSNGAVLYDIVADEVLWAQTIAADELATIAVDVTATLPDAGIAVERIGNGSSTPFIAEHHYLHAWPDDDRDIAERDHLLAQPAVKMLVRCPERSSDSMIAALAPVLGDRADLTFSFPRGLVEISAPAVTKATGLGELARRLDVPAEDVIAFGDMPNDLAMLEWVGLGVAMGNAHPALREVADEITATNADDGIAQVLERWF